MTTATTITRHFVRCSVCLSRAYIDGQLPRGPITCAACGGAVEYLGMLNKGRIIRTAERVPCDQRCTNAMGTICECACQGENHGTHAIVTIQIDEGKATLPVLNLAEAQRIAAEYRSARAAVLAPVADLVARKRAREYLDAGDYWRLEERYAIVRKAAKLRSHAGRMKVLTAALGQ